MPHYRRHTSQRAYIKHVKTVKQNGACQFCELTEDSDQVVSMHKYFKIIKNIFPYDKWDARSVYDHLMITPIKHTETLSSLGKDAAVEYVELISKHEQQGYDIYARSPHSTIKSVPHQHTHLIKTGGKRHHGVIHLEKPYISISF